MLWLQLNTFLSVNLKKKKLVQSDLCGDSLFNVFRISVFQGDWTFKVRMTLKTEVL